MGLADRVDFPYWWVPPCVGKPYGPLKIRNLDGKPLSAWGCWLASPFGLAFWLLAFWRFTHRRHIFTSVKTASLPSSSRNGHHTPLFCSGCGASALGRCITSLLSTMLLHHRRWARIRWEGKACIDVAPTNPYRPPLACRGFAVHRGTVLGGKRGIRGFHPRRSACIHVHVVR
jgi:hypothetical protein